jgi:hypothetical protein
MRRWWLWAFLLLGLAACRPEVECPEVPYLVGERPECVQVPAPPTNLVVAFSGPA